jgi:hypothetical protein
MKKYISYALSFAAVFAFASCNSKLIEPDEPEVPEAPETPVKDKSATITAEISSYATKVTLGEVDATAVKVLWEDGDAFVLTDGTNNYLFTKKEDIEDGKAVFAYDGSNGYLPEITTENLLFRYPADAAVSYASQPGTVGGISDCITLCAGVPEGATSYEGLNVTFAHETSVVSLTLSHEMFKGNEVTEVTLSSAQATYVATSTFTGDVNDGTVVAHFAVMPGSMTGCMITAVCGGEGYEAKLSDCDLAAGGFYTFETAMKGEPEAFSASANCYVVSKAGYYKFPAVKGNGTEPVGAESSVHPVGTPAKAVVLWESFGTTAVPVVGDLIKKDVEYRDGYVFFSTADAYKEGNAVIAVTDADGNILWSWHIWLTDEPQEQVYTNNAVMMDRNLGATSAVPGDAGALGLLYQWGRKDPFLGSSAVECNKYKLAESTITWPDAVLTSETIGTVAYVTANPTTFVGSEAFYADWFYASPDNTLWTTSAVSKSIYDPCPAGWRVPDLGHWSKAGFFAGTQTDDMANYGISFNISSPSATWYPAAGMRDDNNGLLRDVGNIGSYWSASPDDAAAAYLNFIVKYMVIPTRNGRSYGNSVRCVQE